MEKTAFPAAPGEVASERRSIQVISRAATILRALEKHPKGLSLGEIAKLVALPRSTVQRIVDALDRENLLIASSAAHGVRLGPALLPLAAATHFEVADLMRPTLEALTRETGESVDLAVIDQDKVVFVDQVTGKYRLSAVSAVGVSFPLHCSANGKAALAAMDKAELARLRKYMALVPHTPHTIRTWDELERDIAQIRAAGVALDHEENSIGICAAAIAFRTPAGELAAISIPVPSQRFAAKEEALVSLLQRQRESIRQMLER